MNFNELLLLLTGRKRLIGVIALLSVIAGGIGIGTYHTLKSDARQRVKENLRAVAVLKEEQIGMWLYERLGDAKLQSHQDAHIYRLARSSVRDAPADKQRSHRVLKDVQEAYGYLNVELFDNRGQRLDQVGRDVVSASMLSPEWREHLLGNPPAQ